MDSQPFVQILILRHGHRIVQAGAAAKRLMRQGAQLLPLATPSVGLGRTERLVLITVPDRSRLAAREHHTTRQRTKTQSPGVPPGVPEGRREEEQKRVRFKQGFGTSREVVTWQHHRQELSRGVMWISRWHSRALVDVQVEETLHCGKSTWR